jgi:hypothetical protein
MVKEIELEILADLQVSSTPQKKKVVLECCISLCLHVCVYVCRYACTNVRLANA